MNKYLRQPTHVDFIEWVKQSGSVTKDGGNNGDEIILKDLFDNYFWPIMEDLEQDDYFGTEGWDKRFA